VGRLRGRLARLQKEAGKGAVVLEQRDGTRRYFSEMDALRETFLLSCDLIKGQPPRDSSGVIAAVLNATDQSRADFEQRFGQVVGMQVRVVESAEQGGWAETFTLLADGSVEKVHHAGDSPEAERIRNEARHEDAPGSRGVSDLSE
jgi:hypothetical protein